MRRIVVATMVVLATVLVGAHEGVSLAGVLFSQGGGHPITICHRTDVETHPYVRETVDAASTDVAGHELHTGPVWYPGHPKEPKWGDIIPPSDNDHDRSVHPLNWTTTGQALWNHGCTPKFGPPPQPPTITCTTIDVDPQPVSYIRVTFAGDINGRPFARTVSYGRPVPHLATANIHDLTVATGPLHITAHATWTLGPGMSQSTTVTIVCHKNPPPQSHHTHSNDD